MSAMPRRRKTNHANRGKAPAQPALVFRPFLMRPDFPSIRYATQLGWVETTTGAPAFSNFILLRCTVHRPCTARQDKMSRADEVPSSHTSRASWLKTDDLEPCSSSAKVHTPITLTPVPRKQAAAAAAARTIFYSRF